MYSSKFVFAMMGAALAAVAAAQDEAALDAYLAQPDPQGCQVSPTTCTCSLQASSGKCTRPLTTPESPPGVCEQQDCTESYKCDCFGFEVCQINSCGQWKPTAPLPEPVPARYSCEYTPNISKCRTFDAFQEDTTGADNAKDQAVENTIDSALEEEEVLTVAKDMCTRKTNLLKKMKECDQPGVPTEDTDALERDINEYVDTIVSCQADLVEALENTKLVYEQQKQAKIERRSAKEAREREVAYMADLEKKKAEASCPTCADLKQKIKEARQARKAAAIAAGTWSKKARDGKKRVKNAKKNAKEKQLSAAQIEAKCVERSNRILSRISAV